MGASSETFYWHSTIKFLLSVRNCSHTSPFIPLFNGDSIMSQYAYAIITIETKGKVRFAETVSLVSLSWFLSCLAKDVTIVSIVFSDETDLEDDEEVVPF